MVASQVARCLDRHAMPTPVFVVRTLLEDDLERQLQDFCAYLTSSEKYDEEDGYGYWSGEPDAGNAGRELSVVCTNSARRIAAKFGGKVYGYRFPDNTPRGTGLVGADTAEGHDFAVVGDYLVDWWDSAVEGDPSGKCVYDLTRDADTVARKYLPRSEWKLVADYSR